MAGMGGRVEFAVLASTGLIELPDRLGRSGKPPALYSPPLCTGASLVGLTEPLEAFLPFG